MPSLLINSADLPKLLRKVVFAQFDVELDKLKPLRLHDRLVTALHAAQPGAEAVVLENATGPELAIIQKIEDQMERERNAGGGERMPPMAGTPPVSA